MCKKKGRAKKKISNRESGARKKGREKENINTIKKRIKWNNLVLQQEQKKGKNRKENQVKHPSLAKDKSKRRKKTQKKRTKSKRGSSGTTKSCKRNNGTKVHAIVGLPRPTL